ncbi:MAG: phosphoribosylglycinamide formyltransferase [Bacteroidales bacterium]|nr:phosphoribosylglycinamide formyltransferase [Bacteroidales bacterium]
MAHLALFASGNGSNVQRIADYFRGHPDVSIDLVLSNNPQAYVLERSQKLNIPSLVFSRKDFYETNYILDILLARNITHIILAGFLWLIPENILKTFQGKIINIHPALLPGYGGKGMYGTRVHQAVINSGDTSSGITIHYVNETYDEGQIIFQSRCPVVPEDTPETLAGKIHQLEYRYYPEIIEQIVLGKGATGDR